MSQSCWMAAQFSGVSATPSNFASSSKLVEGVLYFFIHVIDEDVGLAHNWMISLFDCDSSPYLATSACTAMYGGWKVIIFFFQYHLFIKGSYLFVFGVCYTGKAGNWNTVLCIGKVMKTSLFQNVSVAELIVSPT